eukprot:10799937-Lingulodinium_polyedra.AAC.1
MARPDRPTSADPGHAVQAGTMVDLHTTDIQRTVPMMGRATERIPDAPSATPWRSRASASSS